MKKWGWFILFVCTLLSNGCAMLALGAAGAAGSYALGPDGMEGISDTRYERLWQKAKTVFENEGQIILTDKAKGKMKAKIGGSTATFTIEQATKHSVIARVQARKWKGTAPDKALAKRLYAAIIKGEEFFSP